MNLNATVVVKGDPALLREYRLEVNGRLAEDGAGGFRERHVEAQLEYEFRLKGGIPFPPFVESSRDFPELAIEIDWSDAATGRSGRAIIQNGVLREQSLHRLAEADGGGALVEARAGADGALRLALVCARRRDAWLGYAVSAAQHAYFRVAGPEPSFALSAADGVEAKWAERWTAEPAGARYAGLDPPEPIDPGDLELLDRLAGAFAREWIWFDESPPEETAVERARFADYGYAVAPANLRAERLRTVLEPGEGGLIFTSFDAGSRWIPGLLLRLWLREAA